jgi:hypothetical protein
MNTLTNTLKKLSKNLLRLKFRNILIFISILFMSFIIPIGLKNEKSSSDYYTGEDTTDLELFFFKNFKQEDKGTAAKPIRKYERQTDIIPIDSITNLISYTAVYNVESDCKSCTADSLYFRSKSFLLKRFADGKKFKKKWVIEDLENQRIFLKVRQPMKIDVNSSSKKTIGEYEFKFQLWVKNNSYKYKFTNIVYLEPKLGSNPNDYKPIYLEHFLKIERQVRLADLFLLAVDRDMKDLTKNLVESMKDPITLSINEENF